jgi:hypothetical protein
MVFTNEKLIIYDSIKSKIEEYELVSLDDIYLSNENLLFTGDDEMPF